MMRAVHALRRKTGRTTVPPAHVARGPRALGLLPEAKATSAPSRSWWRLAVVAVGLALVLLPRTATFAADGAVGYRLWAQDKLRITVYEWRPSKDEIFEWKPINAEYTVQPNGNI